MMMFSIWGSWSVPGGRRGNGREPGWRTTLRVAASKTEPTPAGTAIAAPTAAPACRNRRRDIGCSIVYRLPRRAGRCHRGPVRVNRRWGSIAVTALAASSTHSDGFGPDTPDTTGRRDLAKLPMTSVSTIDRRSARTRRPRFADRSPDGLIGGPSRASEPRFATTARYVTSAAPSGDQRDGSNAGGGGGGGGGSGVGPAGTVFSLTPGPSDGVVAVTYTAGPGSCTAPAVLATPSFTGSPTATPR